MGKAQKYTHESSSTHKKSGNIKSDTIKITKGTRKSTTTDTISSRSPTVSKTDRPNGVNTQQ
jgi:hypothetical protein